jgi:cellobiose phosphorylase
LPAEWSEYTLHYRYRNTLYHIRVVMTGEASTQVKRVVLDGVEQADKSIHLVDDGREHQAVVEVGASAETER